MSRSPNCQPTPPTARPLPAGFGRPAGPVSGSAARSSRGWAGALRVAGAAGPNARASGKAAADAVDRARGPEPGAGRAAGRWRESASGSAASAAAPPAAPLTFQLQEKLPSGRRRRFPRLRAPRSGRFLGRRDAGEAGLRPRGASRARIPFPGGPSLVPVLYGGTTSQQVGESSRCLMKWNGPGCSLHRAWPSFQELFC